MRRLLGFGAALLLVLAVFAPSALAANPTLPHTGRVLVSTGGDLNVPAGEQADAVVIVNGTATIAGQVNAVIAVDATAILNGATVETIVAVRSPVQLGPNTVVQNDVVTFDSTVTKTGNAVVQGETRDLGSNLAWLGFVIGPLVFLVWLGFLVAAVAAGLLLAALGARQVRAAEGLISHEPVETLLVGIGGIFLPLIVCIALFLTVVGAPLGLAIMFGLWPLVAFAGYLVAGIWIGDWILQRTSPTVVRERPYLAAVIGLIVLQVMAIIPFLTAIASLFGFGAVLLLGWRTFRHHGAGEAPISAPAPSPSPA